MNLKFLESLTTRQKQAIAAVGGIIVIAVIVVLVVVLSGGGDDDNDTAEASGTPGQTPDASAVQPTPSGPTPDETDIANGTPPVVLNPTSAPGGTGQPGNTPPPTGSPSGPTMQLTLISGGTCNGSDCFVGVGSTFMLGVEAVRVPTVGYVLMQTYIDFGAYDPTASEDGAGPLSCSDGVDNIAFGEVPDEADRRDSDCTVPNSLTYLPNDDPAAEIAWTDAAEDVTVREALGPGLILHGSISGLIPPLPVSNEAGLMVQVQMRCPANPLVVPITLLPYGAPAVAATSGSLFVGPPAGGADRGEQFVPYTTGLSLHCE